jgi:hypothetical protein
MHDSHDLIFCEIDWVNCRIKLRERFLKYIPGTLGCLAVELAMQQKHPTNQDTWVGGADMTVSNRPKKWAPMTGHANKVILHRFNEFAVSALYLTRGHGLHGETPENYT